MLSFSKTLIGIIIISVIVLAVCIYFMIDAEDKSVWIMVTTFAGVIFILASITKILYHKSGQSEEEDVTYSKTRGYEKEDNDLETFPE